MFPYEDVMLENGLADKPVLLSYRSQQLLLMALSEMEKRYNWLTMDDATWDELESYIAETETEILTLVESEAMTITHYLVNRTSTQAIAAGTPTAVTFNSGISYDAGNPTKLITGAGKNVLQANVHFTAATAPVGYVEIRKNTGIGTLVLARHDLSVVGTNYVNLAAIDNCDDDDYYELVISVNQASTLQNTVFFPSLQAFKYET